MRKFTLNINSVKSERTNYCPNLVEGETESPLVEGSAYTSKHEVLAIDNNKCNLLISIFQGLNLIAETSVIYDTREGELDGVVFASIKAEKLKKSVYDYIEGLIETFKKLNDIELEKAKNRPAHVINDAPVGKKREYHYKNGAFQRKGHYRMILSKDGTRVPIYVRASVVNSEE